MSRDKIWEDQAEQWARFARSPEHDQFFWEFNGQQFLELDALVAAADCGERCRLPVGIEHEYRLHGALRP